MIGASKILTVSYGTFSCTLEGFDDPFNTMRAIAEYFRDLAAEDRYFGAEPPTPDAAMLHRIAEREVQRRVEARIQDNGVILRAGDADDVRPAAVPPAEPAVLRPVAVVTSVAAPPPLVADLDSVLGNDAPAATMPSLNAMPEGVAARLAKIRAAVALAEPAVAAPVAVVLSDFTEDQHSDEAFAPFDAAPDMVEDAIGYAEIFGEDAIAEAAVIAAPEQAEVDLTSDLAIAADEEEDDTDELIADLAALDDATPEDVAAVAEAISDNSDDVMLANLAAMDDANTDDAAAPDAVALDSFDDEDDSSLLADIMADDAVDLAETDMADSLPEDTLIDDEDDQWSAADEMLAELPVAEEVTADVVADDGAIEATDQVAEAPEMTDDPIAAEMPMAEQDTVAELPSLVDPVEPDSDTAVLERAVRARARVIRVRRVGDTATDRAATEAPSDNGPVAPLPDEAEAELQRDLAALEADLATLRADAQDADDDLRRQLSGITSDAADKTDPARDTGVEEDAVRRLMDQTQSEMAVPENRRRLSSIAHLKAAVAATIAERFGAKPKPVDEVEASRTEPYRNDLARSVRPGQSSGALGAGDHRPAPLVLVSEQRIDRPAAPVAVVPVRPRRVAVQTSAALKPVFDDELDMDAVSDTEADTDTDNIFGDAEGFVEFADRVGANGLPELLEAAAAYAAAVEGRDSFTRPQLLRQIALVTGEDVTREDELRSFGTLLRDGRIIKVKRGQFALTESSALLVEARKIAG
jgi:hypothetical protein